MANNGKWLEEVVQKALLAFSETNKSHFLRLYDQTSSGGRGYAQDGDMIWLVDGNAVLIECKSTDSGMSFVNLLKSETSKKQLLRHRLWHRAGCQTLYFYGDKVAKFIAAYDGRQVVTALNEGGTPYLISIRNAQAIDELLITLQQYLKGDV